MVLVRTIAGRSLRQRPGRTLFSVLGIAVGIATVVGIFTLDHNTVLGRGQSEESEWQAEIEVAPSLRAGDRPREELEQLPGVAAVTPTFQHDVNVRRPGTPEEQAERVHLVGLEPAEARDLGAYFVEQGRDLDPESGAAEVLVGGALAATLELAPGDTLSLSRPRRAPRTECVDGELRVRPGQREEVAAPIDFQVVGVLGRDGLGRRARGQVVVVPYAWGLEVFEGARLATRYWLKPEPGLDPESLQTSLARAYSYDLQKSVIVGQAADERAFRNGVRFAGLLAMVLGLFVIFHTLSISLIERVREVGALHALGATRRQVARIFLAEAAVIAGCGGVLGLAGGLALARVLLRAGVTTVGRGYPIRVFEVPWSMAVPLTLLGVAIALLGSIYPLARAHQTSAAAALRGEDPGPARGVSRGFQIFAAVLLAGVLPGMYFVIVPVVGEAEAELVGVIMIGVGILAVFVTLPLVVPSVLGWVCARVTRPFARRWPFAGLMAGRAIQQSPTRVAGAVAAIALVTAGFVGLRGMTRSLEAEVAVWGRQAFLDKVYVRNVPRSDWGTLKEALHRYPGVLGVEPGDARTYVPFLLIGTDVDELAAWGPCRDDLQVLEGLRAGGVVVSTRLANHRQYEVGSQVHVDVGRGEVKSLPVVAISDAYGYFPHPDERLYAVVDQRFLAREFCLDVATTTTLSVRLEEGTPPSLVETAVREALPAARGMIFETGPYLYGWHTSDIRRDFVLFDIILGLTAVLAGLGILNGQLLAALERSKELGVLKALGVTRRQVAGTVLLESLVVGVLGGGVGIALGAGLTPIIVRALQVISALPLPPRTAGVWHLWAWLGALAVAAAAALYPIWRMNRLSALAAVRTGG